jgi:hypothetical protein
MFRRLSGIVPQGKRAKENWTVFVQSFESPNESALDVTANIRALSAFLDLVSVDEGVLQFRHELVGSGSGVELASVNATLTRFAVSVFDSAKTSSSSVSISQTEWISLIGRCVKFLKRFNSSGPAASTRDGSPPAQPILMSHEVFGVLTDLLILIVDLVASSHIPEQQMGSVVDLLLDLLVVNNLVSFDSASLLNVRSFDFCWILYDFSDRDALSHWYCSVQLAVVMLTFFCVLA